MQDQDPIKQLQSLLNDRGNLLERISGIHAVINSVRGEAGSMDESTAHTEATGVAPSEDPYTRLLHMLRDMQLQIEKNVRPLAQEAVHLEVERLHDRVATELSALHACLNHLDQCLEICVERAQEYQREHAGLTQLSQRLTALGAIPELLPECPSEINDIINSRLERMTRQDKI